MKPTMIVPTRKGEYRQCDQHGARVIYAGAECPVCERTAKEGDKQ